METARLLLRLLLVSAPFLRVGATPVYLSGLTPTQDSDLATTAASSLNIDTGLEHTGPDGAEIAPHAENGRWNKKKELKITRQVQNTQAAYGEDVSLASTLATESENIGEEDSSETWLSPLDSEEVPKQFISPQMSTEGATMTTMQDPVMLPAIGPLPKEDGADSLWTEAARPSGADTMGPLSQDDATESTMSSESLPLIFEPLEDVSPEGALSDQPRPSSATVETDSEAPPPLLPDWTSPGQTSGTELEEPIRLSDAAQGEESEAGEDQTWGAVRTSGVEENSQSALPSLPSPQHPTTTVTMTTAAMTTQHQHHHHHLPKSRPGFDEMESDEDRDEDEENSEESVEESEEELSEAPDASTPPPYSLIPPPPVWVQRNQGLMRSWVELIREKAGYVSGMLAPVGIGISGALLLVGALYSIRTIHRKRRNSFKHQRRKSRQPEQPREPGVSGQDQAMLLADSSEDEF
ncbi:hypothetical protein NQD34_018103 [Periophthalmus magnuspinnatus]|nr:hypothetical protein NQD34_018103 [Periophthalmus magnuspinnatus]